MKAEFINPFLESVNELFATMLGCPVRRGEITLASTFSNGNEVVALIGMSGAAKGNVALAFPMQTAVNMVSRLLGSEMIGVTGEVLDAVGELVNIVAGGAKARIATGLSTPVDLSLPTVIQGKAYSVESPSYAKWLDIPFASDLGPFTLRVIMEADNRRSG